MKKALEFIFAIRQTEWKFERFSLGVQGVLKKIYGLNYIRGICAILIVLYHYTTRYLDIVYDCGAEKGHIGVWWGCWAVSAFFILSGLLTTLNIKEGLTATNFMKKRIIRLYPAYWIAIIFITVSTYLVDSDMKVGIFPTLINFTMLQGFIGIQNVDGAFWTLMYELWFYVLVAATLMLKKANYNIISSLWIVCIIIIEVVLAGLGINNLFVKLVRLALISTWANTFIIGISLAGILKNRKEILPYINLFVSLFLEGYLRSPQRAIFTTVIALLCLICCITEFKLKYDKCLNVIALISYPLYLVHQKLGYIVIEFFEKAGYGRSGGAIAAFAIAIAVAYLIHTYIEDPIARFTKRKS